MSSKSIGANPADSSFKRGATGSSMRILPAVIMGVS